MLCNSGCDQAVGMQLCLAGLNATECMMSAVFIGWTECDGLHEVSNRDVVTRELQHVPLKGECVELRVVTDAAGYLKALLAMTLTFRGSVGSEMSNVSVTPVISVTHSFCYVSCRATGKRDG